jgi:hypothetical protein
MRRCLYEYSGIYYSLGRSVDRRLPVRKIPVPIVYRQEKEQVQLRRGFMPPPRRRGGVQCFSPPSPVTCPPGPSAPCRSGSLCRRERGEAIFKNVHLFRRGFSPVNEEMVLPPDLTETSLQLETCRFQSVIVQMDAPPGDQFLQLQESCLHPCGGFLFLSVVWHS